MNATTRINVALVISFALVVLLAAATFVVPQAVSMVFIPLASLCSGVLFCYAMYLYVRRKGYHGGLVLIAYVGPVSWWLMHAYGFQPEAVWDGKIANPVRALILLSGMVALVLFPKRTTKVDAIDAERSGPHLQATAKPSDGSSE